MDNPWTPMDHLWVSMDIHGDPWISMNIHGYAGYAWISMHVHGYSPCISLDLTSFPLISMAIHGYEWKCMEMHGYSCISMDIDFCGHDSDH